jgi:hypothetical protein
MRRMHTGYSTHTHTHCVCGYDLRVYSFHLSLSLAGLSCVPGYCCSESAVEALNAELAELNYQHKRDGVEFVFCRSMPWYDVCV